MGNIGIWQLLLVLAIVLLLFGSRRLRGLGGDLGKSIRGFREGLRGDAEGSAMSEDSDVAQREADEKREAGGD